MQTQRKCLPKRYFIWVFTVCQSTCYRYPEWNGLTLSHIIFKGSNSGRLERNNLPYLAPFSLFSTAGKALCMQDKGKFKICTKLHPKSSQPSPYLWAEAWALIVDSSNLLDMDTLTLSALMRENLTLQHANNKGANQLVHPHSLTHLLFNSWKV